MSKEITVYVGFMDGRTARDWSYGTTISFIPVFTLKKAALRAFEDVRPAKLVLQPKSGS